METLNGSDNKKPKQDLEIVLDIMDLDLKLKDNQPDASTKMAMLKKLQNIRNKANHMYLMIM